MRRTPLLALVFTIASVSASTDCQTTYKSCIDSGTQEIKCACDLSTCSGEDSARIRDYCASATKTEIFAGVPVPNANSNRTKTCGVAPSSGEQPSIDGSYPYPGGVGYPSPSGVKSGGCGSGSGNMTSPYGPSGTGSGYNPVSTGGYAPGNSTTSSPKPYTGEASAVGTALSGLAAVLAGVVAFML